MSTGPAPERIEHYVRMFEEIRDGAGTFEESMSWTVVRPHEGEMSLEDALRCLEGDLGSLTTSRPIDGGYDDETVYLDQRGDAVVILGHTVSSDEEDVLRRLSVGAEAHEVFWLINNFNRVSYAADGVLMTELDVLNPRERWGADPEALTGHLGALIELRDREHGPWPDWETAMATVESLTGVELDADWFRRPQVTAKIRRR